MVGAYARWSSGQAPERVSLIYDTMWHSTEKMTMAIADGVAQEGRGLRRASGQPMRACRRREDGPRVAGLPGGIAHAQQRRISRGGWIPDHIKGLRPKDRIAGAYGSYGWGGGAVKQIDADLRALGLDVIDPMELKYVPMAADLEACAELGRQVARRVKRVKVLGIAGSPRRGGNTETLLDWCLGAAEAQGAEITKIRLCDLDLNPCRACDACRAEGVCV